nr:MAG: hypothetical protein [Bacteriophage sp.]
MFKIMDSFSKEIVRGRITGLISAIIICIIASFIIAKSYYHSKTDNSNIVISDIEIQKHNDSLRIEVNNLDSIKNAKVIEVKTLDNDSTVKLFYQLIK